MDRHQGQDWSNQEERGACVAPVSNRLVEPSDIPFARIRMTRKQALSNVCRLVYYRSRMAYVHAVLTRLSPDPGPLPMKYPRYLKFHIHATRRVHLMQPSCCCSLFPRPATHLKNVEPCQRISVCRLGTHLRKTS